MKLKKIMKNDANEYFILATLFASYILNAAFFPILFVTTLLQL